MSKTLINDLLKRHEGFVSHAYQDSEGYWTIGIGTLIDQRRGGGITEAEAMQLLQNRLRKYERGLDSSIPWWRSLSSVRQAALLDMAYNLGVQGLLGFSRMLTALEAGDYARAGQEAMNSRWARQVGYRAEEIRTMLVEDKLPEELETQRGAYYG